MIGVIDVGGGLRDIYGAGVFDTCLENNINFDCCIGVSAGAANVASFVAKQPGRNYRFYNDYAFRKEYMSVNNLLEGKKFLDLDYVYGVLSNTGGEDPVNFENIKNFNGIINIVATDIETGRAKYFDNDDIQLDNLEILKASSSIPVVCGKTEINGKLYYDGGIADPVPLKRAIELGCDKIVLILTRPIGYDISSKSDFIMSDVLSEKYPKCANALRVRAVRYKRAVDYAEKLQNEGKCLIIAPDDCCGVETLTKDKSKLDMLYKKGIADGKKILDFIK